MMSEGELKLILVQIHHELKTWESWLPGLFMAFMEEEGLRDLLLDRARLQEKHHGADIYRRCYFRLRKYIELQDKKKALEADWLARTGTEWR